MSYQATTGRPFVPPSGGKNPATAAPFHPNKQPQRPKRGLSISKIQEPEELPINGSLTNLRTRLNGGKVLAPLLTALMARPGLASDPQKLRDATNDITRLHRETVQNVQQKLSADDNHPAVTATIARPLAHVVSEAWQTMPDARNIKPGKLADVYLHFLDQSTPVPEAVFEDLPKLLDRSLTEARAMISASSALLRLQDKDAQKVRLGKLLLGDQQTYDGAHAFVRENLIRKTEQAVDKLISEGIEENHKAIAYKSVLSSLSRVYGQALASEVNNLGRQLQTMDAGQRKAYLEDLPNHPDGVLLERATEHLERAIDVLYPDMANPEQAETESKTDQPSP